MSALGGRHFESYSGLLRVRAKRVCRPTDLSELIAQVRWHHAQRRRLTVRANGNALHNQALGTDTMLLVDALPHRVIVTVDELLRSHADGRTLRWNTLEVSGWTPWEAAVRATRG